MRVGLLVTIIAALACPACSAGRRSSARFTADATAIVQDVQAGNFAPVRARFDAPMLASLSEEQLKAAWKQYVAMFGPFRSQGMPEAVNRGSLTVVNVPLTMSNTPGEARVTFDADGKIGGLFFLRAGVPVP